MLSHFPYHELHQSLFRSRRKKASKDLGEESYTLSDSRVSFEELGFYLQNL